LSGFGGVAIVLKSQALAVKVKSYIDAARVAGGSDWHVIFRHIVPNVLPLSFLFMMFGVTEAIAIESTLSFFGLLNVDMTWGLMIEGARTNGYLLSGTSYWWLLFPAGLAVSFLCFAFFLVGRGMDEVINPRLRAR
jgi:peptide/nickel transport system permease protein